MEELKQLLRSFSKEVKGEKRDYINEVAQLVQTNSEPGVFNQAFKKWVVASVANLYEKEKNTNSSCLILCGGQGTGKTSFWSLLFSPYECFLGHVSLRDKDSLILLTDSFLVILDEQFETIKKDQKWERLEALIRMPQVRVRKHYQKEAKIYDRIANFCGTTNLPKEELEGRSKGVFIPFELTAAIDIEALMKITMRKMWGQAYHLYESGFSYAVDHGE